MIQGILKKIFGDKSSNDRKSYQPIIDQTLEFQKSFQNLSDDELREKTFYFQDLIRKAIAPIEKEIEELKNKANDPSTLVLDKEAIFEKIDKLSKDSDSKIEEVLEQILPEAFATIKETARRWSENGKLVVNTKDFDRDLAAKKDGIIIDGDKATWLSKWSAAGAEMEWKMTHYDVQLLSILMYLNKIEEVKNYLSTTTKARIFSQIEPDGSQPLELARTKSFSYSVMNLHGFLELARLGQKIGIDLWNLSSEDGRSLKKGYEFMLPYITNKKEWQFKQIKDKKPSEEKLIADLKKARKLFQEDAFDDALYKVKKNKN